MDETHCGICGECIQPHQEIAEMYRLDDDSGDSVICHAQCGLWEGMELA